MSTPLKRAGSAGRRTSIRTLYGAVRDGLTFHRPSTFQAPSFSYAVAEPEKKYSASVNRDAARAASSSPPNGRPGVPPETGPVIVACATVSAARTPAPMLMEISQASAIAPVQVDHLRI